MPVGVRLSSGRHVGLKLLVRKAWSGAVLAAHCQQRQYKISHSSLQKLSQREGTFPAYQATSSVSSLIYFSSDCSWPRKSPWEISTVHSLQLNGHLQAAMVGRQQHGTWSLINQMENSTLLHHSTPCWRTWEANQPCVYLLARLLLCFGPMNCVHLPGYLHYLLSPLLALW